MKVEVRPLDRKQWHGKTGKDNFSRPKAREVLYDPATGKYATGLTEEKAAELGKKLGVDLSDTFIYDQPHPFWSSKASWIVLPNHTVIFDTDKDLDYIKVQNLKASKYVANSLSEYEKGLWPHATHIIYSEEEEIEVKAAKVQLRQKANNIAFQMSLEDKASLVLLMTADVTKGIKGKDLSSRSSNFIDVEIEDIINNKPEQFLKIVNMGKEEVHIRSRVIKLIDTGVLTKEGSAIFYLGTQLGMDFDSTVEWFKDDNNQKMKVVILSKLK